MLKKKEFNGHYKIKLKETTVQPKKIIQKELTNKLKVNLSSSLKYFPKKKNSKKDNNLDTNSYSNIIANNLQKHNSDSKSKNIMIINNLINCKSNHFLAIFKDYLICDYIEEFLRRIYFLHESRERIPKLYNYYKNYLIFFCKPTFIDRFSNDKIKNYGDLNAEFFYKNNFDKRKNKNDEKKYLDRKIEEKDKNKNNDKEELVKTVFTQSIKHNIDNIEEEENNLNIISFPNKIQQDLLINKWTNESGTLISEGNSLLLMIDEINDQKNNEKANKMNKNSKNEKNDQNSQNSEKKIDSVISTSYKTLYSNKNKDKAKDVNNNNNNIIKIKTYTKKKNLDLIQNMIYSPKPKKNTGFSIKKDKNRENDKDKINSEKNKRFSSPKLKVITQNTNSNINTMSDNKNHNSIVVNINININTNQNNTNINNNTNFKSPVHITKKRLPLYPLSPLNLNIINEKEIRKNGIPLTSVRNKETDRKIEEQHYIKIVKKKNENDNLFLTTKRNKKIIDSHRIKHINSIENNDCNYKNFSCNNKDVILYKKKKSPLKNNYQCNNKINNCINRNVYFSPKKREYKQKNTSSMKNFENITDLNNKKFVYHKKQNYTVNSPLNKKTCLEKKYVSYKRIKNLIDLNPIKDE